MFLPISYYEGGIKTEAINKREVTRSTGPNLFPYSH